MQVNSKKALKIIVNEQLDYGSLLDAFSIEYEDKQIDGNLSYNSKTKTINFTPFSNWNKGTYTIKLESQLEDVAGNNLLRLFDRPVQKNQGEELQQAFILTVDCF